ncbi:MULTISPECIES: NAD-binding protein [unclassified Cyanobium]|uniref:NAD-binding protein n=1 Tax=unclassified Cyanobium TaxID=2627006 RepID=UPI0020CB809B|nr:MULTISPECIES: NAD-binding protein [unclassified Cyanobium]MCP9857527.1 NAD-binding protein [Cyanobium sp. Cruz-8H5]MCP9864901.1 NAD-binding protein [Cyanobium sp. Cruz-8D1]
MASTPSSVPGASCPREGAVLICGLGSLGQACLLRLLPFDVPLRCLDRKRPDWRDPRLEERFGSSLVLGDMRLPHVLSQAGVETARAVLLLSSESTVNVEAALQVRLLNPSADLVVRSSGQLASLGALLEERLPGVAVVDPLLLTAGAVTEALRPGHQEACFRVDGQSYLVVEGKDLDRRQQRCLRQASADPARPLQVIPMGSHHHRSSDAVPATTARGRWMALRRGLGAPLRLWRHRSRLQQGVLLGLVLLMGLGLALFSAGGGWRQGLFVTLSLLKGEYVDPVNVMLPADDGIAAAAPWMIGLTLLYSLLGTLLTSALVAVILERLLRERFGLGHPGRFRRGSRWILLAEGEELAVRVADNLVRDGLQVLLIDSRPAQPLHRPGLVVFHRWEAALAALQHCRLEGIGLLSVDLLANLQETFQLQKSWPDARYAILSHAVEAAERLGDLLGGVAVISSMDLVADAVVATAFGERVEEICRIDGANHLLVRYRIQQGDALSGLNLSRIEHGYGVTTIHLLRPGRRSPLVLPSLDLVLAAGDQLVVLATLAQLRRVELGRPDPPGWRLRLQGSPRQEGRFEALQSLARHLGGAPGAMAPLLDGADHLTPALDRELAEQLAEELRRQGIRSHLESVSVRESTQSMGNGA